MRIGLRSNERNTKGSNGETERFIP
jgi:hypothetical protein